MPHIPAFLPPDLHIVSQAELLLLERGAVARGGRPGHGAAGPSAPWPEEPLDRLLDELERRELAAGDRATEAGRVS
ncbi:hypothetical protein [Arthrobacter sp. L77]|uniref:hypothetical protein n=1 Tax=Arthrobacter sp. L77 TaxID=1496689 RepID=UPI0005BE3516|nr:hypothetical protein [Arthrobacter sp. L77]